MDKIFISKNASSEDKWNALVDALYSENTYDNKDVNYLLTAFDFYNEMSSGMFEGVLEAYAEQIDEDGVMLTKEAIAESLKHIDASEVASIVSSTMPSLKNAMDKYDRALENGRDVKVQEEGFNIAYFNANEKYRRLGDGFLRNKIETFIETQSDKLFEYQ